MELEIILPWPAPGLFPNRKNGRHWALTQSLKKKAQADGYLAALAARGGDKTALPIPLAMSIVFNAPSARLADLDNLLASQKPAIDGIAKALGIDDKHFRPVTLDRSIDPAKKGFVKITFSACCV